MKKPLHALLAVCLCLAPVHGDDDIWESKGPHVRIKRNDQDGSYVVFERSPDDKKLVKTTKDQNDKIKMQATYRRNAKGFLTSGRIKDGQGTLIYRVRYGYDAKTGLLVAEDMFAAQTKEYYPDGRRDPKGNLIEMPVRRVYYFYDADGNQSKAISLVPNKGKTAEDVFSKTKKTIDLFQKEESFNPDQTTSPLKDNPFEQKKKRK